jgi:hypothetical protein
MRWHWNLKSLSHERGRTISAENLGASPFTETYRLITLLAALISLDSPFKA